MKPTIKDAYEAGLSDKSAWDCEEHSYCLVGICVKDDAMDGAKKGEFCGICDGFNSEYYEKVCTRAEFEEYEKEQENKMIYTQEMLDENITPPVGSKFIFETQYYTTNVPHELNGLEVEVIGVNESLVMMRCSVNGSYYYGAEYFTRTKKRWVKPIDARTDKEKLIDDIADDISNSYKVTDAAKLIVEKYDIKLK